MKDVSRQSTLAVELSDVVVDDHALDSEVVREYLLQHPGFFVDNADLFEKISVPHSTKGSVSLVELQGEQLRKKIRHLSQKLNQLIAVAKQNEKIYRVYVSLNLKLMKCKSVSDVQATLEEVMLEHLHLASVKLLPFKGAMALPELQQRLFIEKRFKSSPFFFGRLSQHERQLVFKDEVAESVALVLIGDETLLGMLAAGSADAGHFGPNMDTLLLRQLQQMLTILLSEFFSY
ncbi:DUF484 family protein [Alteromonas sediminis]|uniref:DUF484 family protein n=1 Tax=Alteromonas sediminis TaxID=2259342 RepID=A0A3N5Y9M3_9ALTE|nr:DUF484 family protein [Alteromonas sediminis]RPJ65355.1 DUF484 family protein [Alteromonas sediminis]